jgi:DNA-binding beta-propeller fold protein YncE
MELDCTWAINKSLPVTKDVMTGAKSGAGHTSNRNSSLVIKPFIHGITSALRTAAGCHIQTGVGHDDVCCHQGTFLRNCNNGSGPARHRPGLSCRTDRFGRARTVRRGKAEPPKTSWFFINRGFTENSSAIYDTATGKLLGHVETPQLTDLALDPAGKFYYVSSTLWTKGMRGTRQDYVSVFDSVDLKLRPISHSWPPAGRRAQAQLRDQP